MLPRLEARTGLTAEGVPTNNQRGRRSGPCRLTSLDTSFEFNNFYENKTNHPISISDYEDQKEVGVRTSISHK